MVYIIYGASFSAHLNKPRHRPLRFLLLVLIVLIAGGRAVSDVPEPLSKGLTLENEIEWIAGQIEAVLTGRQRIAVVNFASPSAYFSDQVLREL
jgi:hypothetical protein